MPVFSRTSFQKKLTCDIRLQKLLDAIIAERDIVVICGHRSKEEQEIAVSKGASKLHYPHSKHNSDPSMAFDFAPYHAEEPHIHWDDIDEFNEFIDFILKKADELGIKVRSGRDFPNHDLDHIELVD